MAGTVATLPAGTDLAGVRPLDTHLFLADDTARPSRLYRIMEVDAATRRVTLDAAPTLAVASDWEIGTLVRRYEVFLPAPGDADRGGINLPTSRADPVAYAQVGVSAADDKDHTADDPDRAGTRWGGRSGNEGRVSGPATVYRVHRTPPPAPRVPPDSDRVYASAPDYNRHSYYTVRWEPEADVLTHVFRALDQTVFDLDWRIRQTRNALSGTTHAALFPSNWSAGQRNAAAAELNAIAGPGSYAGLSADAREMLGRLPGNEGFASAGGLDTRDWLIRRTRTALDAADTEFFPDDWNDALVRQAAADMLNAIGRARRLHGPVEQCASRAGRAAGAGTRVFADHRPSPAQCGPRDPEPRRPRQPARLRRRSRAARLGGPAGRARAQPLLLSHRLHR